MSDFFTIHGSRFTVHDEKGSTPDAQRAMMCLKFEAGSIPLTSCCSLLTAHRSRYEDHSFLERRPFLFPFRNRGSEILEGSSDRSASHGRRIGGDRSNRINDHHHPLRSAHAGAPQAPGAFALSQLSEHDETMDLGRLERVARLSREIRDAKSKHHDLHILFIAHVGRGLPRPCLTGGLYARSDVSEFTIRSREINPYTVRKPLRLPRTLTAIGSLVFHRHLCLTNKRFLRRLPRAICLSKPYGPLLKRSAQIFWFMS